MVQTMPVRILLAEDDRNLGNILKAFLDAKGFATTLCINGQEAINTFRPGDFEFCILDIMMPVKDGFTAATEIRARDHNVPILFLTAKSLQEDKLKGFEIGADDYITKPFSMEELMLRMQAILRRTDNPARFEPNNDNIFNIGGYIFDYNRQTLIYRRKELKLTSKEAGLLRLLCLHANDVLERSEALRIIWNDDSYFNARSMDVYIAKLRKYLRDDPNVELINVHSVGFKLVMNQ